MQALYNDKNRSDLNVREAITGATITRDEVVNSINKLKKDRTTGLDGICGDLLKLMQLEHLDIITDLFNYV